jgi:hypothetical protein
MLAAATQRASMATVQRKAFAGANVPDGRVAISRAAARPFQQQQRAIVCQAGGRRYARALAALPDAMRGVLCASYPLSGPAAAVETPSAQSSGRPSLLTAGAPDTYAIVEVGGRQMFVEPGKWYTCNRLQVRMGGARRVGPPPPRTCGAAQAAAGGRTRHPLIATTAAAAAPGGFSAAIVVALRPAATSGGGGGGARC